MPRLLYYQLRQLRTISRSLTSTATAILIHAFVTSRLGYCSTLYVGLPALRLGCLERVIYNDARLIGGIPRTGHVHVYLPTCLSLMYSTGCPSNSGSYVVLVSRSESVVTISPSGFRNPLPFLHNLTLLCCDYY